MGTWEGNEHRREHHFVEADGRRIGGLTGGGSKTTYAVVSHADGPKAWASRRGRLCSARHFVSRWQGPAATNHCVAFSKQTGLGMCCCAIQWSMMRKAWLCWCIRPILLPFDSCQCSLCLDGPCYRQPCAHGSAAHVHEEV